MSFLDTPIRDLGQSAFQEIGHMTLRDLLPVSPTRKPQRPADRGFFPSSGGLRYPKSGGGTRFFPPPPPPRFFDQAQQPNPSDVQRFLRSIRSIF